MRAKVYEAFRAVGLDHRGALPARLSAGEQQRVCLARAIVNDPQILLADSRRATWIPRWPWRSWSS